MANFIHNLAIAIGINQYQNGIAKLKTAKHDAQKVADILRDEYQYQVELITDDTDRKPTLKELEHLLTKWLPEQLQPPAENNRLLFYFAGHGMPLESDDGPRGFLLPQDAHPNNSKTFLPMQVLHDALVALPCHHLLVILDCCFAGTFRWSTTRKAIPILETIHQEHYDRFIRYPAWQVITSAAHNQEALDFLSDKRGIGAKSQHQAIQHSPFAEALFEALQHGDPDEKGRRYKKADLTKDGVITAPELYLYLRDNVETRSSERQTPGLYPLNKHDRGEYIFHDRNFDPQSLSKADPIDETNNPYRGLKPFEEEHARFFFGRQELIENLYARIAAPDHSLTVVLGVSGSGKSSLVKAGLIPYLRESSKPPINSLHQWHILNPIRPGESPFAALARTIWAIADMPTTVQLDSLGFLSEKLNKETKQLNTQVAKATNKHGETSRTTQRLKQEAEKFAQITSTWNQDTHAAKQLLIVEHFETLYTLCQTPGEPESQQQQQLKQVFLACLNPLTERLQSAPNSLVEIVKAWSQKHPDAKLLLVIDQFEELITLGRKSQPNPQSNTPEEWQQFLQLLETTLAATLPQLRIIVTLRSDFEPRFLNSEALKSYWTRARFPVRAMRSDELRQAIEGPASEMALYFEPANLVDRLIDEVGQMPGALPLLSFTLSEFYIKLVQKWRVGESSDRALTIDAEFDKEGGIAGSLTRRANEECKKIGDELGEAAQQTMRRVMLRMLTLEGGETARRRVPESELVYPTQEESDRVKQVVDRLVEARLLVKGQLETGEPYVEAAHDFLVRGWGKLQNWIDEEKAKETLELKQRLTAQANDWDRNNRPDGLFLSDGDRLNHLEKLLKQNDIWLNQRESQFVETSLSFRDAQKRRARELQVRAELQQKAARVLSQISINPLEAITIAIQATGQNLEELPNELLAPVQRSLHIAMNKARIPKRSFVGQHTSRINSIAFHPNSQYIVSGSDDKTIRLWNWEQDLVTPPFLGHEGEVTSVVFGHNGQYIISGSTDGTIRLWNFQLQLLGKPFVGHKGAVNSIAISPDGQFVVSGGDDGTIRFWNLRGEQLKRPLNGHQGAVNSIAISPDGRLIVSGGVDNTVRLWNQKGKPIKVPFVGHQEVQSFRKKGVCCVVFSPDSQCIASSGTDGTIRLWNLEGELIIPPLDAGSSSVCFHPNGRRLASVGGGQINLWTTDGHPVEEFFLGESYAFNSIAFSSNGKYLVTGSDGKALRIWDLEGDELVQPIQAHETEITTVTFSPDGQTIASSSFDKAVRLWNLEGKQIEKAFEGHDETVYSIAFSPKGEMIVSGSYDRTIRLWNLKGEQIGTFGNEDVRSVAFSPNGQIIASTGMEFTVRLWDLKGSAIGCLPYGSNEQPAGFNKVAYSPDGQKIACLGSKFSIRLWDWNKNLIQDSAEEANNVIQSIDFNSDGRMIVTSDVGGSVCLWDLDDNFARQEFRLPSSVHAACFSPVEQTLVSGTADGKVFLWDTHGNIVSAFQGHDKGISAVAFSPDGRIIASGGWNGTIQLWRGSWKAWLKVCCDRVRHHPVFKDPQTDSAKAVCEICQKYVWSKEDTSV